jgi:chromate transporter
MVAYIRDLAVGKKHWLSPESFADGTALCQSIPGATAMQATAYVGPRARGVAGALAAFVGFGLPAFVLMVVLSAAYGFSRNLPPVAAAFRGQQVVVLAIVANAVVAFGRSSIKNWRDLLLACGAVTYLVLRGSPILVIVGAAAFGAVLYRGASLPIKAVHDAGGPTGRGVLRPVLLAALAAGSALCVLFVANRLLFNLAVVMLKVDVFAIF